MRQVWMRRIRRLGIVRSRGIRDRVLEVLAVVGEGGLYDYCNVMEVGFGRDLGVGNRKGQCKDM
jgi:hypothetical protein